VSAARVEIASVETVSHTIAHVSARTVSESASVIPAVSSVVSPAMTSSVVKEECWASEVEVASIRIDGVNSEVPVPCVPIERAVEIVGSAIESILPVEEYVTQVEVTSCPVVGIKVTCHINVHQVVEVNLVSGLILVVGEIELVCHLVGQEEGLLPCLLIAHGLC